MLERRFWQVSDPRNEDYGQYLTNAQITKLIGTDPSLSKTFLQRVTNELFGQSGNIFKSLQSDTVCQLNENQEMGFSSTVYVKKFLADSI